MIDSVVPVPVLVAKEFLFKTFFPLELLNNFTTRKSPSRNSHTLLPLDLLVLVLGHLVFCFVPALAQIVFVVVLHGREEVQVCLCRRCCGYCR